MIFNPCTEAGSRGRPVYQAPQRCVSRTPSPVAAYAWEAVQQVQPLEKVKSGAPRQPKGPRRSTVSNLQYTQLPLSVSKATHDVAAAVAAPPAFEQEVSTPRGAVTTPWRETVDEAGYGAPAIPREVPGRGQGRRMTAPSPAEPTEVMQLKLKDFVKPQRTLAPEPEAFAEKQVMPEAMCVPCGPAAQIANPTRLLDTQPRLWADINDEEFAENEATPPVQGMSASQAPSRGSIGHPYTCADACKYALKKRGCKDGANCDHCHLCEWNRYVVRGRARAGNRQSTATLARTSSGTETTETVSTEASD